MTTTTPESATLSSELWKQSDYLGRWNLRYVEYREVDGILCYYHDKTSQKLRGIFSVDETSAAQRTDPFDSRVFTIICGGQKWSKGSSPPKTWGKKRCKLVLRAQSDVTAAMWLVAFNRKIVRPLATEKKKPFSSTTLDELAQEMHAFPGLVHDRSIGIGLYKNVFMGCDAVAWLVQCRRASRRGSIETMNRMIESGLCRSVPLAGTRTKTRSKRAFSNAYIPYEFVLKSKPREIVCVKEEKDETRARNERANSSGPLFRTRSLSETMARVAVAAAKATKVMMASSPTTTTTACSPLSAAAARLGTRESGSLRTPARRESSEPVARTQEQAIRELLRSTPPRVPGSPTATSSSLFWSTKNLALDRRLETYLVRLRDVRKKTIAKRSTLNQTIEHLKKRWKSEQGQLRAWAREAYLPIFKKRAEMEIGLYRIELQRLIPAINALSDRIDMASNLVRVYSSLSAPERVLFSKQIDASFFVSPSSVVVDALKTRGLTEGESVARELRKLNEELNGSIKGKLEVLSSTKRSRAVYEAVLLQMKTVTSGDLVVAPAARASFAMAVADQRTPIGRTIARFRKKIRNAVRPDVELPPPTIVQMFCGFLIEKIADRIKITRIVSDDDDDDDCELKGNVTRKMDGTRALSILVEDLVLRSIEVSDLIEKYFRQEDFARCDKYWQQQQETFRHVPPQYFGIASEFLPSQTPVQSVETPVRNVATTGEKTTSNISGCVREVATGTPTPKLSFSTTTISDDAVVSTPPSNKTDSTTTPERSPSVAVTRRTGPIQYLRRTKKALSEWAAGTASVQSPTLMRLRLLRAIRVLHQDAAELATLNTGTSAMLTGETIVPLCIYALLHCGANHMHRSQYFMQFIAQDDWSASDEVAYYLTAMNAALAFVCHLRVLKDGEKSTVEENPFFTVGDNPYEAEFRRMFDTRTSTRARAKATRDMKDFLRSQETVEDLLLSLGVA